MTAMLPNINTNNILNNVLNNLPTVDGLIQSSRVLGSSLGKNFVSLMDSEEVMQGCSALAAVVSIVAGARMLFGSSPAQSIVIHQTFEVIQNPILQADDLPSAAPEASATPKKGAASKKGSDELDNEVAKMGDGLNIVGNQVEIKNSSTPVTSHIQQASISRISRVCNGVLGLSCIGAGVLTLLNVGVQANLIPYKG